MCICPASSNVLYLINNIFQYLRQGPGGSMRQVFGLPNNTYKPITNTVWVRARLCKLQKRCPRLAAGSDKVYQLLAHGRWFSPGTPASSTTKTGRHDIAEILLKVALNTKNQSMKKFNQYLRQQELTYTINSNERTQITTSNSSLNSGRCVKTSRKVLRF